MATHTHSDESMQTGPRVLAGLLLGLGLLSRAAPLLDQGGRLLRQFPTEDGYLMLTIARNIGIGHGMSIADGTIPTNGTQPLATLIWAAVFGFVDGDKAAGVAGVLLIEILVGIASVGMLFLLGRRVLAGMAGSHGVAAVAATAWFASAQTARHGMNCLESGISVLLVTTLCWALLRFAEGASERPALARWAGLGAILGVAFWARIDAVLLCAAIGVVHLGGWLPIWRGGLRERFLELCAAGTTCALIASPWLIHNLVRFGSIMPVSGQSEGFRVSLGRELPLVPAKLVEYLSVVLQIPGRIETDWPVMWGATALLGSTAFFAIRASRHWSAAARSCAILAAAFGSFLVLWYGLFFGAGHFMSRYMFPVSPFLALLTTASAVASCRRMPSPVAAKWALALFALLSTSVMNARLYAGGDRHQHFHVVEWVDRNVPDDVWIGAVQTGTVGFFHDRTVNLDGKVNPEAMAARRTRSIPHYVVESSIQYLVDWMGITKWAERYPEISEHFEVLVQDEELNFGVLGRRGAPRKDQSPQRVDSRVRTPPERS